MSEKTPITKSPHQRRTEALERIRTEGRKAHPASPDSPESRKQNVQRKMGVLNEEGRYPSTATHTPDRLRNNSLRKRASGAAAVTAIAVGGGLLIDRVAPEPVDVPHPGNMESFSGDPLQHEYNQNPAGFTVEGGQIIPNTGHDGANDLALVSNQPVNELNNN